jgi:polar amino acid transport system permease protein
MSACVALGMSFIAGLARTSRWLLVRLASGLYVEVFRGTSGLVQIFFFFFVLPLFGVTMTPVEAGVLALGLNFGAYGSEVVRSSIQNVDRGQREAGIALDMPEGLIMRRIILPQAIVAMLPPFGNLLVELVKVSSLLSVIALSELTFTARTISENTLRTVDVYFVALVLYFLMAYPLARIVRRLERRASRGMLSGRALG